MKKLLTIALALVMVLALAAPAMATVGFGPQPEAAAATATEWTVKIRALEFVPVTSGFTFENNYFADYDPTKGIVAGSDIRFVVDVTFPKYGDISSADEFEKHNDNMTLVVSGNNLAFGWTNSSNMLSVVNAATMGHETLNGSLPRVTTNSPTKSVKYMAYPADYDVAPFYFLNEAVNTLYYSFASQKNFDDAVPMGLSKYYTTTYSFMFVADVLNTTEVTVSAAVDATGYSGQFAKNGTYTFTYNGDVYTAEHTANSDGTNYFDVWNTDDPRNVVRFVTDSKDQILNVAVTVDSNIVMGYTDVTPLTYAELSKLNNIVAGMLAGSDAKYLDYLNGAAYAGAIIEFVEARLTTDTNMTAEVVKWINDNVAVTNNGAAWTTADLGQAVIDAMIDEVVDAVADYSLTVAGAKALLTTAGQAQPIPYPALITSAAVADAVTAWQLLKELYTFLDADGDPLTLVIGVPADQIASSITGVPVAVSYTNSVPFLGWLGQDTLSHAQWWNVNKDVKLAEIVFNLNDRVHTNGYSNVNNAGAVTQVRMFKPDAAGTHNDFNKVRYAWCDDTVFDATEIYAEVQNLYDFNAVTASKDVNKVMYNRLYPVFKEIMNVLGFEWDGTTAYMYRAAFVEKFGGKLYTEATYTYAAYTSALIVADPNALPPQTGDTTSVLGFVMIAVAVLAAAAVVVKKVRA